MCRMVSAAYFARSLRRKSHKNFWYNVISSTSRFPSGCINFILPPPAAISPYVTPFDIFFSLAYSEMSFDDVYKEKCQMHCTRPRWPYPQTLSLTVNPRKAEMSTHCQLSCQMCKWCHVCARY